MLTVEKLEKSEEFTEARFGPVFREMELAVPKDVGYPGLNFDHVKEEWQKFMQANIAETWAAVDEKTGETVGCLGAMLLEDFYTGTKAFFELFWFLRRDWRKTGAGMALFRAFESCARERGATEIWAGASRFHDEILMSALYERLGFTYWGSNYRKALL
jgi:GNAT superfamily N-acetyltransferase